jgi:hypothetical protein
LLPVFPVGEFRRVSYVEAIQEGTYRKNAGYLSTKHITCLQAIQIQIDPAWHQLDMVTPCIQGLGTQSRPECRERRGQRVSRFRE